VDATAAPDLLVTNETQGLVDFVRSARKARKQAAEPTPASSRQQRRFADRQAGSSGDGSGSGWRNGPPSAMPRPSG